MRDYLITKMGRKFRELTEIGTVINGWLVTDMKRVDGTLLCYCEHESAPVCRYATLQTLKRYKNTSAPVIGSIKLHKKLQKVYHSMIRRCYNPKYENSKNYAGRGITVCQEWLDSYLKFFYDMSESYQEGLTLDRTNNDSGYRKDNCRWVTPLVQTHNRRCSKT